jgi:two-component system sensor histidine kinase CpxA
MKLAILLEGFRPSRHRLFFKIFVAFWTAMTATGVLLLALETERAGQLQRRSRIINGDAVAFYAVSLAKDHEDKQTWESREFLQDLRSRTSIRGWLFDHLSREVSGHDPAELRRLRTQIPMSVWTRLRGRARIGAGTHFEPLGGVTLAAHAARGPSGQIYLFVGALPQSRFGPWNAAPHVQALRLLTILVAAGTVSWILARHLTRPVETLRQATQHLAQGDLSARAAHTAENQRDELGDLSRDFNQMATRLEALVQERERLVEAQKRLLGDVAHELRSPLARLSVALELARDATVSTSAAPETEAAHARIEREIGRLKDLISRLLTLSRLESGVQKLENVSIELPVLIESVVADANFEVRPTKTVAAQIGAGTGFEYVVQGTPDLLRSALENIVRNALRHTPDQTSVQVSLWSECDNDGSTSQRWNLDQENCYASPMPTPASAWAVVSVRDEGTGVPPDELREVFRPFYRAGKGRATRDGGAGLGLTIALRAVELHGGQMRACNAEDGGLLVEMRLPLALTLPDETPLIN